MTSTVYTGIPTLLESLSLPARSSLANLRIELIHLSPRVVFRVTEPLVRQYGRDNLPEFLPPGGPEFLHEAAVC